MDNTDVNKICTKTILCTIPLLFLFPSWITAVSVALTIYFLVAATNSIRDGEIEATEADRARRKKYVRGRKF
jgi:hypothetical protein